MGSLLLSLSFIGVIVLVFTKHYLLGASVMIASFTYYVSLQPTVSWLGITLVFVGLLFLIAELIIPGFGLAGVTGFVLMALGVSFLHTNWQTALIDLTVATITSAVTLLLLVKLGFSVGSQFVLRVNLPQERQEQNRMATSLLKKQGKTKTPLRPVGIAVFDKQEYEVLSMDFVIEAGVMVEVVKVEHNQIFVAKVKEE